MSLPPELVDDIFYMSTPSPKNVRYFGKNMSKKTMEKMLNCKKVIDTGKLSEVKRLKFFNTKCSHDDMMYAAKKGYSRIVDYIDSEYPSARITKPDIVNASIYDPITLAILLENNSLNISLNEYIEFFKNILSDKSIKVLFNKKPGKRPIKLSEIFDDEIVNLLIHFPEYVMKLIKMGKNKINIDNRYLKYLFVTHQFDLITELLKIKRLDQNLIQELRAYIVLTHDDILLGFLVNLGAIQI